MIYRQRNRKKKFGIKIFFGVLFLFIILRLFNIPIFVTLFDKPVHYIVESNLFILQPFKNSILYFKDKKQLQDEVNRLKKENIDLKIQTLFEQTTLNEFEVFKQQFASTTSMGTVAKVILKPPFSPFDTITISGNLEKILVNDFVFYNSILIGKVVSRDNTYAKVELFSTPEKVTPILLHGVQFEAKGLGGGRYVFEASKEFEVASGDPIVFPDQKLIILGVVEFIESKEEDLFKKIYFNLPIPFDSLLYVTVGS